ncbi:unnamed protein product, partial [Allacma fusca]
MTVWKIPIAVFLALAFVNKVEGSDNFTEENSCSSSACVQIGEEILASMDSTGSPCENFYNYACGNWSS